MKLKILIVDPADDVATALTELQPGEIVAQQLGDRNVTVKATEPIPYGHKIALRDIAEGEEARKYGAPIGRATANIPAGAHIHLHNITTQRVQGLA